MVNGAPEIKIKIKIKIKSKIKGGSLRIGVSVAGDTHGHRGQAPLIKLKITE
ncbi:hypothetical protein EMIT0357P_20023 [Pseudomonas marginalis]